LPKLNSLYYGETTSVDRRKDPAIAARGQSVLLDDGRTPLDYMDDLVGDRDVAGGFFNRFITICGTPRKTKSRPRKLSSDIWSEFRKPLTDLTLLNARELDFELEAYGLWAKWFDQWSLDHGKLPQREQLLTERIPKHALKIALVYSIIEGKRAIDVRPLAISIKICGWLESNTRKIFQDVRLDRRSKAESVIIRRLKPAKNNQCTYGPAAILRFIKNHQDRLQGRAQRASRY
jgi:hypothetical protein